jgi:magnesium transporter
MTPPSQAPVVVVSAPLSRAELRDNWDQLSRAERLAGWKLLGRDDAEALFLSLTTEQQVEVVVDLPPEDRRHWMRLLPPDDAADVIQFAEEEQRPGLLSLLDPATHHEVSALLAYAEDVAGGLMNPRFGRLRADWIVEEAILYLRRQARELRELIRYLYVVDPEGHLLGVVSFRELFAAEPRAHVRDVMRKDPVAVTADLDQEAVSQILRDHHLVAVPVIDAEGRMKGVVTVDDVVHVVNEEATEDIQKMGGTEALDAPYLNVGLPEMIRKRGLWLSLLFLGEMLTASAMHYFEADIAAAVVLAMFIPLIISSGGNSGSQATTLVIRAMALGEVKLSDWWRVVRREFAAGLALGSVLGTIGFFRIAFWPSREEVYGPHYMAVAVTVASSLVGVVMFGTFCGSMLPFLLRRLGLDPASASAPFVATLVDVTGILIYFSVAHTMLAGTLL